MDVEYATCGQIDKKVTVLARSWGFFQYLLGKIFLKKNKHSSFFTQIVSMFDLMK